MLMRISFNTNALRLVIILALCGGRCFGTKGQKRPPSAAGRQQQTHDEHGSPYFNFEQSQKQKPEPLTIYANVEPQKFKQFVQDMTGQPKATPDLPGTSDSFQQPESAESWIKDLMSTGAHLKQNSGPSTAPIMPQNSAMLYNSTGRTSMPGQSSAALALPGAGGTSTALQPGQSTWIRKGKAKATSSAPFQPQLRPDQSSWMKKGKAKATSSASFKQPKSGRSSGTTFSTRSHLKQNSGLSTAPIMPAQNSAMLYNSVPMSHHQPSGTNFFMADTNNNSRSFVQQNSTGSHPFPTAHGQSSAALALPGDADGTSTAFQPNQSTSNASDAND